MEYLTLIVPPIGQLTVVHSTITEIISMLSISNQKSSNRIIAKTSIAIHCPTMITIPKNSINCDPDNKNIRASNIANRLDNKDDHCITHYVRSLSRFC